MSIASPRLAGLRVHSVEPLCAGPDESRLVDAFVTPVDLHFVRNHGSLPSIDAATYRLRIEGLVSAARTLSLADLKAEFPRHEVTATLQCAGNRRQELHELRPLNDQVLWGGDGIGTARWAGVRLVDVLDAAGIGGAASDVWFESLDEVLIDGEATSFGASIAIERGRRADVVLAFEMNGEPLTPEHGAPLRVVVPGYIGARSVKWLRRIVLSDGPSPNHFQRDAYRLDRDGSAREPAAIEPMALNSFTCRPPADATVEIGAITVTGYATGSGSQPVCEVELAVDGGAWLPATLLDVPAPGTWVRWECPVRLGPGRHEIVVRATDAAGHVQPSELQERWNPAGYMNDASHRIHVTAVPGEPIDAFH